MLIDCDTCEVRGPACADCVVTAILDATPGGVHLDSDERGAVDVLAAAGLVSPLRLVSTNRTSARYDRPDRRERSAG